MEVLLLTEVIYRIEIKIYVLGYAAVTQQNLGVTSFQQRPCASFIVKLLKELARRNKHLFYCSSSACVIVF